MLSQNFSTSTAEADRYSARRIVKGDNLPHQRLRCCHSTERASWCDHPLIDIFRAERFLRLPGDPAIKLQVSGILQIECLDLVMGIVEQRPRDVPAVRPIEQDRHKALALVLFLVNLVIDFPSFPVHAVAYARVFPPLDSLEVSFGAHQDDEIRSFWFQALLHPPRPAVGRGGNVLVKEDNAAMTAQLIGQIEHAHRVGLAVMTVTDEYPGNLRGCSETYAT